MKQNKKDWIVSVLTKLTFVYWDRYFEYSEGISFYGWIDRNDNYKDFVVLDFIEGQISYSTSSDKYSKKIADILNQEHSPCQRVEYFCDIKNMIKLEKKNK